MPPRAGESPSDQGALCCTPRKKMLTQTRTPVLTQAKALIRTRTQAKALARTMEQKGQNRGRQVLETS